MLDAAYSSRRTYLLDRKAADQSRTDNLLITSQLLYQLSYDSRKEWQTD